MKVKSLLFLTPLGSTYIQATDEQILSVAFPEEEKSHLFTELYYKEAIHEDEYDELAKYPLLLEAKKQFKQYFTGTRCYFKLPFKIYGTPIEQKVYRLLSIVPFGYVISYLSLSQMVGINNGARFIGSCMKKNPLPLIIPCHRVISNSGKIGGFSAGVDRKKFLLQWEKTNWEMSHESNSVGRWLWYTFKRRNGEQTKTTN